MLTNVDDAGRERYRRAALTAAMNLAAQFIQLMTGLISVPLALNYVGPERFGIWVTLSTALAFITFSDFGIGIGMQDRMSRYTGRGDYEAARNAFFSAFILVGGIVVLVVIIGWVVLPRLDLSSFFELKSSEGKNEIQPTAIAATTVIALGLLSGIVQRAFNSIQEGFWVALLQVIARFVSLALLFVVVHFRLGLPALVFVVGGLSSCVLLVAGVPLLIYRHHWLRMRFLEIFKAFDISSVKGLLSVGVLGLGASIAIYLVNNSTPFLISAKHGAESVADFAILMKLLAIPGLLLTYILNPLWPAIAEANQKKEFGWIRAAYRRSLVGCFVLGAITSIATLFLSPILIKHWTGKVDLVPSFELLVPSLVFVLFGFWNGVLSVILNGLSRFAGQASYGLFIAIAAVAVAALLPNSLPKEYVVWIISIGFGVRCVLMQLELRVLFSGFLGKNTVVSEVRESSIQ